MKIISILIILISTLECSQKEKLAMIEYKAQTRGAIKHISVNRDRIFYNVLNKKAELNTTSEDWNNLCKLLEGMDIEAIENYERPSTKSYSDAAMTATLHITIGEQTYISKPFDDGNPPEELKEIINKLFDMVSE